MLTDNIVKAVGMTVPILMFGKFIYDVVQSKRSGIQQDYKIAKDFLEDSSKNPEMHHFVIERGYQAIAGTSNITVPEAKYLLSLENPNASLKNYLSARTYVEFINNENENQKIQFLKKYQSQFSRSWRRGLYFLLYIVSTFLTVMPIFFFRVFTPDPAHGIVIAIIFLSSFGFLTFFSLKEYYNLKNIEKLVKNQRVYQLSFTTQSTQDQSDDLITRQRLWQS